VHVQPVHVRAAKQQLNTDNAFLIKREQCSFSA